MMAINYLNESEKYRPEKIGKTIETLLVGESPPLSGKKYFYVPRPMSDKIPIQKDRNLPATIFNHYFKKRPTSIDEYVNFLLRLQAKGIFLIDICDEPINARGNPKAIQQIIKEIPYLRSKMKKRKIKVADEDIVFLLARKNYLKDIRREFPNSGYKRWIDFRMSPEACCYNK
ncbi:MAG: hypothetical protein AB1638_11960 [Nitrospirota bacterium]